LVLPAFSELAFDFRDAPLQVAHRLFQDSRAHGWRLSLTAIVLQPRKLAESCHRFVQPGREVRPGQRALVLWLPPAFWSGALPVLGQCRLPAGGSDWHRFMNDHPLIQIFLKGGPIMWPLLLVSIAALATVLERLVFLATEKSRRNRRELGDVFARAERGDFEGAVRLGRGSRDYVARVMTAALEERNTSFTNALLAASAEELKRFNRGLPLLDTVITLSPLLGLLGTVVGMIHSFGLIAGDLDAPAAITGGIAEALIATAFGLGIAITALLPFNYLNTKLEDARRELEVAGNRLELLLVKHSGAPANEPQEV
jgi:biopolymer transport protein ExbB